MRKLTFVLILAATLAGARSASAATESVLIHGNSCFNTTKGVDILYSHWGPYNPSTTTGVTVHCPITLASRNYTSMYLQVSGWSLNNSALKLSCTITATRYDGGQPTPKTATLPYNNANYSTQTTTMNPNWQNVWPYITCYIPPNNGNGPSYLSTLSMIGTY